MEPGGNQAGCGKGPDSAEFGGLGRAEPAKYRTPPRPVAARGVAVRLQGSAKWFGTRLQRDGVRASGVR